MNHESASASLGNLWQGQPTEPARISPEDFRGRMQKFERTIAWRNIGEYLASAIVVIVFGFYAWKFPTLALRIGCGLIIAGTLYVVYQLHQKASSKPAPAEWALTNCIEFQRRQMIRQRDALRSVLTWYLLPFVPGMFVFLLGLFQFVMGIVRSAGRPFPMGIALASFAFIALCITVVFFVVWKLNDWAAKKLQVQIDELDELTKDSR